MFILPFLARKPACVLWFSIKPSVSAVPSVMVGDTTLSVVSKQQYLGVMFDGQLNWRHHVAGVCKSMSYYLSLIRSHVKSLPSPIIKMLMESLVFLDMYMPCLCGVLLFTRMICLA